MGERRIEGELGAVQGNLEVKVPQWRHWSAFEWGFISKNTEREASIELVWLAALVELGMFYSRHSGNCQINQTEDLYLSINGLPVIPVGIDGLQISIPNPDIQLS